jgi:photosystem II stability/assembly factor-like uncharacterized protein
MRRTILCTAAVLGCITAAAEAQKATTPGIKLADIAGTWYSKTLGPKDSVLTTTVLTTTANGKGWTMAFPTGDPVALRVVSSAGDSVVTEAGPFASRVRQGQTVTLLHSVSHYKGNEMWGTSRAQYSTGDTLTFKVTATRKP